MIQENPILAAIVVVAAIVLFILFRSVRMTSEWNRAVVLRLGRFAGVRGPGLFLLLPLIDRVAFIVDMRVETTTITAEQALTRDTVAVGVDAIVFWQVADAAGRGDQHRQLPPGDRAGGADQPAGDDRLDRPQPLLSDRKSADEQLRITIGSKTESWGVTIRSVEIKDVAIPAGLQDAMSRQAQAEREKQARVTLASRRAGDRTAGAAGGRALRPATRWRCSCAR